MYNQIKRISIIYDEVTIMKSIFISSTFRDMQYERDLIQEKVLPELREFMKQFGESIEFVDLRWGIDTSKEDAAMKKVLEVCFDNIQDSKPYFLSFLGNRYGTIIEEEVLDSEKSKYYLGKSVTEAELEFGPFKDEDYFALFFFRDFADTNKMPEEIANAYQDDSIDKQDLLKQRIVEKFPEERIFHYKGNWNGEKLIFDNLEDYLINTLKEQLRKEYQDHFERSPEEIELNKSEIAINLNSKYFSAREDDLKSVLRRLEDINYLIVSGKSGSGKTTFISELAQELKSYGNVLPLVINETTNIRDNNDLLLRLIWGLEKLLGLPSFYNPSQGANYYELWKHYNDLLLQYNLEENLYILIDGLDQLSRQDEIEYLFPSFLPEKVKTVITTTNKENRLFENINKEDYILKELSVNDTKLLINNATSYRELSPKVVDSILEKANIRNPLYLSLLVNRLSLNIKNFNEIYKSSNEADAITDELRRIIFNSSNNLEDLSIEILNDAKAIFDETLVEEYFRYIAGSKNGLRVQDIMSLLQRNTNLGYTDEEVNRLVLERLRKYLDSLLMRDEDGRVNFKHQIIRKGFENYFKDKINTTYQEIYKYLDSLDDNDTLKLEYFLFYSLELNEFRSLIDYIKRIFKHDFLNQNIKTKEDELNDLIFINNDQYNSMVKDQSFNLEHQRQQSLIEELANLIIINHDWIPQLFEVISKDDILFLQVFAFVSNYLVERLYNSNLIEEIFLNYNSALNKLSRLEKDSSSEFYYYLLDLRAGVNYNLGKLYKKLQDYSKAENYFDNAINLIEKMASIIDLEETRKTMIVYLEEAISNLINNMFNIKKAEEYFSKLMKIYESSKYVQLSLEVKIAMAHLFYIISEQDKMLDNIDGAIKNAKNSLLMYKELYKQFGFIHLRIEQGKILNHLGNLLLIKGNFELAKRKLSESKKVLEELDRNLDYSEIKVALVQNNILFAKYYQKKELYEKSIQLLQETEKILENNKSLSNLKLTNLKSKVLYQLGRVRYDLQDFEKSILNLVNSLGLKEDLNKRHHSFKNLKDIAKIKLLLGRVYLKINHKSQSLSNLKSAQKIYMDLLDKKKTISEFMKGLADCNHYLSILYEESGQTEESFECFITSEQIYQSLERKRNSYNKNSTNRINNRTHKNRPKKKTRKNFGKKKKKK